MDDPTTLLFAFPDFRVLDVTLVAETCNSYGSFSTSEKSDNLVISRTRASSPIGVARHHPE